MGRLFDKFRSGKIGCCRVKKGCRNPDVCLRANCGALHIRLCGIWLIYEG